MNGKGDIRLLDYGRKKEEKEEQKEEGKEGKEEKGGGGLHVEYFGVERIVQRCTIPRRCCSTT